MDDSIAITPAKFDDQGALGAFLKEMYLDTLARQFEQEQAAGFHTGPAEDELMAADDFYFSCIDLMDNCFFARDGGKVIGAAAANPYTSELQYLVVAPDYRRRGIGRELLGRVLAELEKRGAKSIRIYTGVCDFFGSAREFLVANGFIETRQIVQFGRKIV